MDNHHLRMGRNRNCYQCVLKGFLKHLAHLDQNVQDEFVARFEDAYENLADESASPALYYEARKILWDYIPNTDAERYEPIKKMFNDAVLAIEDSLQKRVDQSDSPLELAIKTARAGNYLDVGCVKDIQHEKLLELIDQATTDQLDPQTFAHFTTELSNASSMVYLTDNAGEAVLDKILIRTLKRLYPAVELTVIVRGGLAQSDITMEDAEYIGLTKEAHVISSGVAIPGTALPYLSAEARSYIDKADLILAKGQGNFESLCGCGLNIYYVFLCKCPEFTRMFQLPQFSGCFLREYDM